MIADPHAELERLAAEAEQRARTQTGRAAARSMMHAAVLRLLAFVGRHDLDLSPPLFAGMEGGDGLRIAFVVERAAVPEPARPQQNG